MLISLSSGHIVTATCSTRSSGSGGAASMSSSPHHNKAHRSHHGHHAHSGLGSGSLGALSYTETLPIELSIQDAIVLMHQPAYPVDLLELGVKTCGPTAEQSLLHGCNLKSDAKLSASVSLLVDSYREQVMNEELSQRLRMRGYESIAAIRVKSKELANATTVKKVQSSTAIKAPYFRKAKTGEDLQHIIKSLFTIA
jgi:hypothetical protein